MKFLLFCLVACSLALCAPSIAVPNAASQARQAIQATCDRNAVAYLRKDLNGCMAMYAPTLRSMTVAGRATNYKQMLAEYADDFALPRTVTSDIATVHPVTLHGALAYAVIDWHHAARYSSFTYTRDFTIDATWEKKDGRWKIFTLQFTRDSSVYQR